MAQRALNLVRAALTVIHGQMPFLDADEYLIAHNDREPIDRTSAPNPPFRSLSIGEIPRACLLAARASRCRSLQYALIKYRLSTRLFSVPVRDLEPYRAEHLRLSSFPDDHVTFSTAITVAYSAIEDLGLELRASASKPSRINGQWNPVVKKELEERLSADGVAIAEPILWTIRGSKTKIQEKRPVPTQAKARWAVGPAVRDSYFAVIDAIAYASWLRSKIAAHAAQGLTRSLSPYDVSNVQHLARRLILEVTALWPPWSPSPTGAALALDSRGIGISPSEPSAGSSTQPP
jgi:hypothetical protein